ncbi:MAG: PAS domain S-box protein [Spirochaetes bacterium]|nr:MAG: PAS domain S-box protein [Spirochaetota bacterium]
MDPAKILIVEDELIISSEIRMMLEHFGYRVAPPVTTGEAAITAARAERPDLILMDIQLAGRMDGIEAVERIRAEQDVPVIYLTANADDATVGRARDTRPHSYVCKPVSERELYSNIDSALFRHSMESRLRESERRYRLLAENSSDVIWTMTLDGRFTYVSPSVTALTGWTPEEVLDIPLDRYIPPEQAKEMGEEILKELALPPEARALHRTVRVKQFTKNGALIDVEVITSWLTDARGNIIGLQGATRDIGARLRAEKELEERARQVRHIVEHSIDLFYLHDTDNRFQYVSPQSLPILGWTPAEMMRQWTEILTDNPVNAEGVTLTAEAIRTGNRQRPYELEVYHKNGGRLWLEINESPVRDEKGAVTGIVGAARDITAQKAAIEKERRITVERDALLGRLMLIMERMPLACVLHDVNFNVSFWNNTAERIFGFSREEVMGKSPIDLFVPPRVHDRVREIQRRMRQGDMSAHNTNENVTKDGRTICCEWHNTPLMDEGGVFLGYLSMAQDISERRRAEEALAWSLERYRRVVETSQEGIWMIDAGQLTTFVNPRMAGMLGYSIEEMIGKKVTAFMHPDDLGDHAAKMDRREKGMHDVYERRFLHRNGGVVHLSVSGRALKSKNGEFMGSFGMFTDITGQKHAESQREAALTVLRESEERYRTYLENAPLGVFVIDTTGRFIEANPASCATTGYTRDEMLSMSFTELLAPESREAGVMSFVELGSKGTGSGSFTVARRDGTHIYVAVEAVRLNGDSYIGFSVDITARRKAQEDLAKLSRAVEQSPTAIIITDASGSIEYVNPQFTKITGYLPDEVVGKTPRILKSGFTSPNEYRTLWMTILSGATWQGIFRNRKKNGELYWESALISPVRGPSGDITHMVAVKEDITGRKDAEERLVASLREKEIMLKEIHHRVKNNFQVIISMLNLQERTINSPEVREHFNDSRNRIRSMALIHEKLYQSRDLSRIDFSSYINSLTGELFRSAARGDVPPPSVDCEQVNLTIEQAIPCGLIVNELLSNAFKYAFPRGLTRRGFVRVSFHNLPDDTLELVVSDNGIGLPVDVDLSKTKSLGLSLAPLLVQQIDGTIELSREGGTTYTIRFRKK